MLYVHILQQFCKTLLLFIRDNLQHMSVFITLGHISQLTITLAAEYIMTHMLFDRPIEFVLGHGVCRLVQFGHGTYCWFICTVAGQITYESYIIYYSKMKPI